MRGMLGTARLCAPALERCVFGARSDLRECTVHCYKAQMPRRARDDALGSPRMPFRHPIIAVRHLIDGRRPTPLPWPRLGTGARTPRQREDRPDRRPSPGRAPVCRLSSSWGEVSPAVMEGDSHAGADRPEPSSSAKGARIDSTISVAMRIPSSRVPRPSRTTRTHRLPAAPRIGDAHGKGSTGARILQHRVAGGVPQRSLTPLTVTSM